MNPARSRSSKRKSDVSCGGDMQIYVDGRWTNASMQILERGENWAEKWRKRTPKSAPFTLKREYPSWTSRGAGNNIWRQLQETSHGIFGEKDGRGIMPRKERRKKRRLQRKEKAITKRKSAAHSTGKLQWWKIHWSSTRRSKSRSKSWVLKEQRKKFPVYLFGDRVMTYDTYCLGSVSNPASAVKKILNDQQHTGKAREEEDEKYADGRNFQTNTPKRKALQKSIYTCRNSWKKRHERRKNQGS